MEGERIQKVLARAGVGSRRAVEEMMAAGRVRVNGSIPELGRRIDPQKDQVEVDGSPVPLAADLVHYLLNKPVGVVATASDPEGRPTVVDLVDSDQRIWPVGRLDIESEGAIIVTNDGDLAQKLTHPRYEMPKTYLVEATGSLRPEEVRLLRSGVELDDGTTAPARAHVVDKSGGMTMLEITITEGRNRQVRRMCEAIGHPAKRLVRTAIGPLQLGRLKPGRWRKLAPLEVQGLHRAAGGGSPSEGD
jgi:23S rRNA pseudouridine2605 synthase